MSKSKKQRNRDKAKKKPTPPTPPPETIYDDFVPSNPIAESAYQKIRTATPPTPPPAPKNRKYKYTEGQA